jgi:hypothetical protein
MEGCEVMAHYSKTPYKLASEVCSDSNTVPPFSNCVATRQTYSCNMCSWCRDACPTGVDMGELFKYSREDRWRQNKWIPALHEYWLRELDRSMEEGAYASPGTCGYVFFPGCQLTASAPRHVESAWRFLREGWTPGSCWALRGAPAVWAGDLDRREKNAGILRKSWERMGRPVIITACATCAERLPDMLKGAEIRSLYEVLDRHSAPPSALPWSAADVFDPCSARKDDGVHRAVRALAEKAGCAAGSVPGGKCCGYGGHIRLANPELYAEITENRVSASEKPYIVYCAIAWRCSAPGGRTASTSWTLFSARAGENAHPGGKAHEHGQAEGYDHEGTGKQKLCSPCGALDALQLTRPRRCVARRHGDKLITDRDVKETIMAAEADGDYFLDEDACGPPVSCGRC